MNHICESCSFSNLYKDVYCRQCGSELLSQFSVLETPSTTQTHGLKLFLIVFVFILLSISFLKTPIFINYRVIQSTPTYIENNIESKDNQANRNLSSESKFWFRQFPNKLIDDLSLDSKNKLYLSFRSNKHYGLIQTELDDSVDSQKVVSVIENKVRNPSHRDYSQGRKLRSELILNQNTVNISVRSLDHFLENKIYGTRKLVQYDDNLNYISTTDLNLDNGWNYLKLNSAAALVQNGNIAYIGQDFIQYFNKVNTRFRTIWLKTKEKESDLQQAISLSDNRFLMITNNYFKIIDTEGKNSFKHPIQPWSQIHSISQTKFGLLIGGVRPNNKATFSLMNLKGDVLSEFIIRNPLAVENCQFLQYNNHFIGSITYKHETQREKNLLVFDIQFDVKNNLIVKDKIEFVQGQQFYRSELYNLHDRIFFSFVNHEYSIISELDINKSISKQMRMIRDMMNV